MAHYSFPLVTFLPFSPSINSSVKLSFPLSLIFRPYIPWLISCINSPHIVSTTITFYMLTVPALLRAISRIIGMLAMAAEPQ